MPDADHLLYTAQTMSHYPIEDFSRILDVLRNEKPVYYHQLSNGATIAWLRTSVEPVDEGESV